jgi:hypothetical protein
VRREIHLVESRNAAVGFANAAHLQKRRGGPRIQDFHPLLEDTPPTRRPAARIIFG